MLERKKPLVVDEESSPASTAEAEKLAPKAQRKRGRKRKNDEQSSLSAEESQSTAIDVGVESKQKRRSGKKRANLEPNNPTNAIEQPTRGKNIIKTLIIPQQEQSIPPAKAIVHESERELRLKNRNNAAIQNKNGTGESLLPAKGAVASMDSTTTTTTTIENFFVDMKQLIASFKDSHNEESRKI